MKKLLLVLLLAASGSMMARRWTTIDQKEDAIINSGNRDVTVEGISMESCCDPGHSDCLEEHPDWPTC